MDRVFLSSGLLADEQFVVRGAARRHLADSLRVRPGDQFLATDGEGSEYLLQVESSGRNRLVAQVLETRTRPAGAGHRLTLAIAPPKGRRMETAVEKAVECGVGRIVPIETEHSVVRAVADSEKVERWKRVAQSATAQSGRLRTPVILPPHSLPQVLELPGRQLMAHPGSRDDTIAAAVASLPPEEGVNVLIGPEGGFSPREVEEARRRGAIAVSLGPTRLRTETAAIVAVALAIAALGDLAPDARSR